jgi:hypothetical protein
MPGFALLISCGALVVSFLAYLQAKNTQLLGIRREAINHVRAAMSDVKIHGNITANTVASIREAFQISSLVFSSAVVGVLDQAHGIAFRLQHKPSERQTDQDFRDEDCLVDDLDRVLNLMIKQTALGGRAGRK